MSTQVKHSAAVAAGPEHEGTLVALRRNVLLSGVVGGLALLLGVAYLLRSSSGFDTLIGLVMLGTAALHLPALVAARAPILVADEHGIRLRLGLAWRGVPWRSIRQVVVETADSPLREGRLVLVPRDPEALLDHLGPVDRVHLAWNRFWYGAELSVPLGMTTVADTPDLARDLIILAQGRADVVAMHGRQLAQLAEVPTRPEARPETATATGTDPDSGSDALATIDPFEPVEIEEVDDEYSRPLEPSLPEPVAPLREVSRPIRVDVRLDVPDPPEQSEDTVVLVPDQRRGEDAEASAPGWHELVVNDLVDDGGPAVPAAAPVIGPKVVHAREMLDMSIDELSQRTRIRPHVLEAIEVDDFGPCGGDFYARGHLTAICRALGLKVDDIVKAYDEHYAQGPINARRVFEAELSTGLSGGMRATLGGPRWSLLIGSVLCLAMVWGLARIFAGAPEHLVAAPDPTSQSAGLAANHQPITSPLMKTTPMTVTASHAPAHVVVTDRTGKVLWSGDLSIGTHRKIVGLAPFTVAADNAGAVDVTVKGKPLGTVGTAGTPGTRSFR